MAACVNLDRASEQSKYRVQAAIDVSGLGDTSVDPADVASYHFKLGRVLWETKAKGCAAPRPCPVVT